MSGATVINVERGVYNGPGSSLTVGDVVVENVTVNNTKQGYPITSTSVLTVNGSTTSQPAEFTAGDITIVNSTADRVANFSNAKVETGKILVDNSSIGYGVNAGSNADVTIDSIEWKGTDLSSALLVAEKRADLVVRNGIVVEGDAENYIRATGTGDSGKLIRFHNNADTAVVGGDISLKYIEAQAGLIFAHEVNDKVAFADIVVDHVKIDAGQSAVQLGDDAKETFSLETGTISVSDLNYVEADRYQFGVKLSNLSNDTSVEDIYVDGIHYGEAGTNSGSNALGAGGISVSSSSFKDVVDTLSVKNITTTSEDSKIGYTGIYLSNVEGDIGSIVVDSLDSKGTGIETDGLSFSSGDLGYGQISIANVSSGGTAYGMKISGKSTLLNGIEGASQRVVVSDIEGTEVYGVYALGSGSEFSGKMLSVEEVTATDGEATGLLAGTRLSFDAVTVKSVEGTKQVSGLAFFDYASLYEQVRSEFPDGFEYKEVSECIEDGAKLGFYTIGGYLTDIDIKTTKSGSQLVKLTLENNYDFIDVLCFSTEWERINKTCNILDNKGSIFFMNGQLAFDKRSGVNMLRLSSESAIQFFSL